MILFKEFIKGIENKGIFVEKSIERKKYFNDISLFQKFFSLHDTLLRRTKVPSSDWLILFSYELKKKNYQDFLHVFFITRT